MKRLLYPLLASALITITPLLATFENGQDIVRGLFGYEEFAILLFLVLVKNKVAKKMPASLSRTCSGTGMTKWYTVLLVVLIVTLFSVAWIDLQNLLAIKGWETDWYGVLPFVTCGLAIAMVWKLRPFSFTGISFILFVALIAHLAILNKYAAQPLAQFPTIDYLERIAPKPVQRKHIADDYKAKYMVTDSVTITRDYVDTSRNNVIILVESWGVPLDTSRFSDQLKAFEGVSQIVGIHNRMYSRTRTAEREDLMLKFVADSTRHRDTTFLPKIFADIGHYTTFLFGGDSLEHWRYKYIRNIGFGETIFGHGQMDATMASKIDSILIDTTQKHFMAWTTMNTKFPMQEFPNIYGSDADAIDSVYSAHLAETLRLVADLAKKHSNVRFIVQGDHNPILSPIAFQERFYKRWVPFIILN